MKCKPILFSTEMVRAILDGRKTVTRRLVKQSQVIGFLPDRCKNGTPDEFIKEKPLLFLPYCNMDDNTLIESIYKSPYQVGDILYVRETWKIEEFYDDEALIVFKANGHIELEYENKGEVYKKLYKYADKNGWQPSLFMPKEAARIFLKVTDVRVERLHDITEEQTEMEGFEFIPPCLHQVSEESYCDLDGPCNSKIKYCDMSSGELFGIALWNTTVKEDWQKWESNPYVWVISFERCEKPNLLGGVVGNA